MENHFFFLENINFDYSYALSYCSVNYCSDNIF